MTRETGVAADGRPTVAVCVALTGGHAAVAVCLAWTLNLWVDEAYTLNTTGGSLWRTVTQALHFELQPPLYFILVNIWRVVHDGVFFARLFSVACTVGALALLPGLSRRFAPGIAPAWTVAALVLNPFVLHAASDMRTYGLVLFLSAVLLYCFHDGFLLETARPAARRGMVCAAVAALYTQYYLGFLLAGFGAALLVLGRWRALRAYCLAMLVTGVCFLPLAFVVPGQVTQHTGAVKISAGWFQAAAFLPRQLQYYLWPVHDAWPRFLRWPVLLVFWAGLAGCAASVRTAPARRQVALWLSVAVAGAFYLATMLFVTGRGLMELRHSSGLLIPFTVSVYALFSIVPGRLRIAALVGWTTVLLGLGGAVLLATYTPLARTGDWARVAACLEQRAWPREPVLVFPAEAALPLAHYVDGEHLLVPLPAPEDFARYDLREFVLEDAAQVEAVLRARGPLPETLWVVTNCPYVDCGYLGVDFNEEALEAFLEAHYRNTEAHIFLGSWARRFVLHGRPDGQPRR